MRSLLIFTLKIALLATILIWLAEQPGDAHIVWHDYVIDTSAAALAFAIFLVGYGVHLIFRAWNFLMLGPALWRIRRRTHKLMDGQTFIARGMAALAAGQVLEAGRLAIAARKKIGDTPLVHVLQAQTALAAGDRDSARQSYQKLTEDDDTLDLGYRGLVTLALREGDHTALDEARAAWIQKRPQAPMVRLLNAEIAVRQGEWAEGETALRTLEKTTGFDRIRLRRWRGVMLTAQARDALKHGLPERALAHAEQAILLSPDWLPAILTLAHALDHRGH